MKPSAPSLRSLEAAHPWFELFQVVSFNPTSATFEMLLSQKKPKSLGPSFPFSYILGCQENKALLIVPHSGCVAWHCNTQTIFIRQNNCNNYLIKSQAG